MSPSGTVNDMAQGKPRDVSLMSGPANAGLLSAFRTLGRKKRAQMAKGPGIVIISNDGQEVVTELYLALFNALSEKPNLVQANGGIHRIFLPAKTLPVAVKELVARITTLTDPNVDVIPMDSTGNLYKDVHIASAADQLGLGAYTQRMLNAHWQRLKTTIPGQADVDTISKIDTPLGSKLFSMIARDLAKLSYNNKLPNSAAFEAYLATNPRFSTAVASNLAKFQSQSVAFSEREARRRYREDQVSQAELRSRKNAMKEAEERAKEKARFDAKNKEEKEIGECVREKMRLKGSKYTAMEAGYIWKMFGKRVPVGLAK